MGVFLLLEASQPCGTKTYRLGLGVRLAPKTGFDVSRTVAVALTKEGTSETGCPFRFHWIKSYGNVLFQRQSRCLPKRYENP